VIARCFVESGYRRTTTAELAEACEVQETILYRLWPGKKEMFLAAIDYVYELSAQTWREVLDKPPDADGAERSAAERLLEYEARHLGEFGLYRIYFAGLTETDDAEVRSALRRMFRSFHHEISARIEEHRSGRGLPAAADADQAAWAFLGLGLMSNLSRDLEILGDAERRALIAEVGRLLLEGTVL
jgi:TetR/AcrR family transcriptional repressor of nem operon